MDLGYKCNVSKWHANTMGASSTQYHMTIMHCCIFIAIVLQKKFFLLLVQWYGVCASCYAFAAMGALEGANALSSGYFVSLSEQNIIDCSGDASHVTLLYNQTIQTLGLYCSTLYHKVL